jgi:hypothetical protein
MTRDSVDEEWLTDDLMEELDSPFGDDGFTFSADGLSVVFGLLRGGNWDLWQSQRSDRTAPWDEPCCFLKWGPAPRPPGFFEA